MQQTKSLRPAAAPEQHRGEYSNRHTKHETGGIRLVPAEKGFQPPLKTPCAECPLRRDSASGYLGGYSPEMYLGVLHGPASLACHSSKGFHEGVTETQRHCTGVAAYRANVGHLAAVPGRRGPVPTPAHEATLLIGKDPVNYFAAPHEFVDHHKPGQKR